MMASPKRKSAVVRRSLLALTAVRALGCGASIRVLDYDGAVCGEGLLRALPNSWMPKVELSLGGSNLLLCFGDGTEVPLEQVEKIEQLV